MGILDTEKTNKHTSLLLFGLILAVSCVPVLRTEKASASCGWTMTFGDEGLPCGQGANSSDTVRGEIIGESSAGYYHKIALNNYQGGAISFPCGGTYGSCASLADGHKLVFELFGDNVISAPDGFGIDSYIPIEFTGQGSLKIVAKIPIGDSLVCPWTDGSENKWTCSVDASGRGELEQLSTQTVFITPRIATEEAETSPQDPTQDENGTPTEDGETSSGDDEDEKKCPDSTLIEQTPDSGWTVWDIAAAVYVGVSLAAFIGLAVRWFVKRKKAVISENTVSGDSENNTDSQDNTQGVL